MGGAPSRHRPNEVIHLDEVTITHINGHCLPEPFAARVRLHLYPGIACRIESDALPKHLVSLQKEAFEVTTAGGFRTKVFLRFNLNDLMHSGDYFRGYLILFKSPCMVIDPEINITSVEFSVLNFQQFYGKNDRWITSNGNSVRLGLSEIVCDDFQVEIAEDIGLSENRKFLSQNDGLVVTHSGRLERRDGRTFSAKDAGDLLRYMRAFLSFCRGAACGLTLVKANYPDGRNTVMEWGTSHTEAWICGSETWLPTTTAGDIISQLFPGFWKLRRDPDWADGVFANVDWYLNCNSGPFHVGIVLAQAALESLSHKVLQREMEPMHNQIRRALESIDVNPCIPQSCRKLGQWLKQVQGNDETCPRYGADAIVKIRNDLVHADKKHGGIPPEAVMDALRLSQWYIEMILLRKTRLPR